MARQCVCFNMLLVFASEMKVMEECKLSRVRWGPRPVESLLG